MELFIVAAVSATVVMCIAVLVVFSYIAS